MKILPVGTELFHSVRPADRHMKLIVAFRIFSELA
jgi:hypothetical protein